MARAYLDTRNKGDNMSCLCRIYQARHRFDRLILAALTCGVAVSGAQTVGAQRPSGRPSNGSAPPAAMANGSDTATVQASRRYGASEFHRLMLGDGWRDLWQTEIDVPVLDLRTFAGGLKPTEIGGGAQTRSLRFKSRDGLEYVFRPVYKERLVLEKEFHNTIVEDIFSDGLSHSHPTAPVVAKTIQSAAGLLHPNPVLVVMPDSPLLGEFREDFAGKLGTIEEHASMPDDAPGLGGAVDIIDSDDLLEKLNEDPTARIDAHAYLTARLVDFLIGDNDRHRDQWRWAKLRDVEAAVWVPIPRDRDKAFVSHDGLLLKLARFVKPILVKYEATYPSLSALSGKVTENDRRLLADLERTEWDSVANALRLALTDSVIGEALREMPREYHAVVPDLAAKLKARRDKLPEAARRYYGLLFAVADVHATDADDRATITRAGDGIVDVELRAGDDEPYLQRRFHAAETREVRVYLHGGDDRAVVKGAATHSIPIRVIGGNGTNEMLDSSMLGGKPSAARFYDRGTVTGVTYGPDTAFNRRPWSRAYGDSTPPIRDYGSKLVPTGAIKTGRGMGIVPKIGFKQYQYRFRHYPYATLFRAELGYSTEMNGWEIELAGDRRFESSPFHVQAEAELSQLDVAEFRGFGNDAPGERDEFFDVRQRSLVFHPSLAYAFGPESDLSLGPVVRSVTTDSLADRFISAAQPYGFPSFTQAGLRLTLRHDRRDDPGFPRHGVLIEATGSAYPAMLDVRTAYQELSGVASAYVGLPVAMKPVLAFRAGGKKLFGEFPYYDAAFLGGSRSLRTLHRDRYAGDASLYGSAELRVPLGSFGFVLPWNAGLIGFLDAGRVYVDGKSPGGWHSGAGAGFWLGVLNPETSITVTFTNNRDRRLLFGTGTSF